MVLVLPALQFVCFHVSSSSSSSSSYYFLDRRLFVA
jgi:hypothetical protein